jgi:hypothetical protein
MGLPQIVQYDPVALIELVSCFIALFEPIIRRFDKHLQNAYILTA